MRSEALTFLGISCPKINMISLKEQKKSQKYLMQENKFSGILGLFLYAKPNNCMQLWNQYTQPRDIFFDILSMSFPCSHRWYLSACRRLPLLGIWKLKQKSIWLNKTEDGPVHLILCSHKGYLTIRFTYDNIKWGKLCGVFFDEGVNISRLDALAMKMILNTSCSTVGNTIKYHIITDF